MGQETTFLTARRSVLRRGGDEAQKAFWGNELGFLTKAAWFDKLLWDKCPREFNPSEQDRELIQSDLHSDCEQPLTTKQLEWVISRLEELDRTVASMPCDPKTDHAKWNIGSEPEFEGTPNGVAIMRKVYDVLFTRCEFFGYPWLDADHIQANGKGTAQIREVLREVISKYNAINKDGDFVLYKTTG